jgi:hypothetical protein
MLNQTMIVLHYALVRHLAIALYWLPYLCNLGGQNHDAKRGTIGGHRNTDWQSWRFIAARGRMATKSLYSGM